MTKDDKKSPDKTKDLLIEAANHLFAKKGFAGTSVKDIADRAGVNISLVSYHFGGKEGLYVACLEPFIEEKMKFFERNILRPTSRADFQLRLRLFIEDMLRGELDSPDSSCIIRRDVEMDDPILLEIFKKTIAKAFDQFVSFIKSGQDAGYLNAKLDPRTVCLVFIGGIQHAIRTDAIRKKFYGLTLTNEKHRTEFIDTTIEMFFNGVGIHQEHES